MRLHSSNPEAVAIVAALKSDRTRCKTFQLPVQVVAVQHTAEVRRASTSFSLPSVREIVHLPPIGTAEVTIRSILAMG